MQTLLLAIFLVLSFSSQALALPKLPPLPVEQEAFRALRANKLEAAYTLGKECLQKHPNASYAKQCIVVATLNGIGNLDEADATLRTMKPSDYQEGQVVYYWILLEFARKNYKKAKEHSDQLALLPSNRDSIHGDLLRADLFHRLGDQKSALEILSRWKDFEWVTSNGHKGSCEKTIKAIKQRGQEFPMVDMTWLRDIVPLNKIPIKKLGLYDLSQLASWYAEDTSKLNEVVEIHRTIAARFPENQEAVLTAASFMVTHKRPELCLQFLNSLGLRGNNSDVYWYLKSAALTGPNSKDSIDCINKAIAINPKEIKYYSHRYAINLYLHNDMEALTDLEEILQLDPGNWQLREQRAKTRMGCKMFNEALEDLKLLSNNGTAQQKFEACLMMADLFKRKGDLRQALATIQQARKLGYSAQLVRIEDDITKEANEVGIQLK